MKKIWLPNNRKLKRVQNSLNFSLHMWKSRSPLIPAHLSLFLSNPSKKKLKRRLSSSSLKNRTNLVGSNKKRLNIRSMLRKRNRSWKLKARIKKNRWQRKRKKKRRKNTMMRKRKSNKSLRPIMWMMLLDLKAKWNSNLWLQRKQREG